MAEKKMVNMTSDEFLDFVKIMNERANRCEDFSKDCDWEDLVRTCKKYGYRVFENGNIVSKKYVIKDISEFIESYSSWGYSDKFAETYVSECEICGSYFWGINNYREHYCPLDESDFIDILNDLSYEVEKIFKNSDSISGFVCKRLQNDLDKYEEMLTHDLTPVEIVAHSYETVIKNEIVSLFEMSMVSLDDENGRKFCDYILESEHPLDELYQEWLSTDLHINSVLEDFISDVMYKVSYRKESK